jgi:O-antigen ligase
LISLSRQRKAKNRMHSFPHISVVSNRPPLAYNFPRLAYQVGQRRFCILLLWLLIAPIASNLINKPGANPFFTYQIEQTAKIQHSYSSRVQNAYLTDATTITIRELLEPTRVIIGGLFIFYLLNVITRNNYIIFLDWTEVWMALFSLLLVSSVLLRSNRIAFGLRIATDAFLIPFLAYYIAKRLVINEDRFRQLVCVLGYLSSYLIIISLVEILIHPLFKHRVHGPYEHRDLLYIVIMVTFFMVLLDFLINRRLSAEKRALPTSIQWFILFLAPFIIFHTMTRGNWMGFAFGIWILLLFGRRLIGFHQKLVSIGLAFLIIPVAIAGIWTSTPDEVLERAGNVKNIDARLVSWGIAINEGLKHPFFGIGLNNLRNVFGTTLVRFQGTHNLDTTHNCYLAIFIELGLAGLFAYMAIIISIVQMGSILYRMHMYRRWQWCGVIVIAIMVAYLLPAFTSTILYVPAASHVYVFVSVGAIVGLYRSHKAAEEKYIRQSACEDPIPAFY